MRSTKEILESMLGKMEKMKRGSSGNFPKRFIELENSVRSALKEVNGPIIKTSLSSDGQINYGVMERIAMDEVYPNEVMARYSIETIKEILQKEKVGDNESLSIGYHENKFSRTQDGWDKHLEKTIKLYIDHIVA